MTTSALRGIATVTSLRLCSRAPETTSWSEGGIRTDDRRANRRSRPSRPRLPRCLLPPQHLVRREELPGANADDAVTAAIGVVVVRVPSVPAAIVESLWEPVDHRPRHVAADPRAPAIARPPAGNGVQVEVGMLVGHEASVDGAAAHFDLFCLFLAFQNFSSATSLRRSALDCDLSLAMRSSSSSESLTNSLCRCRLPTRGTLAAAPATTPDAFATIRRRNGGPARATGNPE